MVDDCWQMYTEHSILPNHFVDGISLMNKNYCNKLKVDIEGCR